MTDHLTTVPTILIPPAPAPDPAATVYHVLRGGTGDPEVLYSDTDEMACIAVRDELLAARPHGDLTDYFMDLSWAADRTIVDLELREMQPPA